MGLTQTTEMIQNKILLSSLKVMVLMYAHLAIESKTEIWLINLEEALIKLQIQVKCYKRLLSLSKIN